MSSPLGRVASLILVAGDSVAYPGVASSSMSMRPNTAVPALPTTRRWTWERNCWAENSTRPR